MRRYTGREGQERYLVMLLDEDDDIRAAGADTGAEMSDVDFVI